MKQQPDSKRKNILKSSMTLVLIVNRQKPVSDKYQNSPENPRKHTTTKNDLVC